MESQAVFQAKIQAKNVLLNYHPAHQRGEGRVAHRHREAVHRGRRHRGADAGLGGQPEWAHGAGRQRSPRHVQVLALSLSLSLCLSLSPSNMNVHFSSSIPGVGQSISKMSIFPTLTSCMERHLQNGKQCIQFRAK